MFASNLFWDYVMTTFHLKSFLNQFIEYFFNVLKTGSKNVVCIFLALFLFLFDVRSWNCT